MWACGVEHSWSMGPGLGLTVVFEACVLADGWSLLGGALQADVLHRAAQCYIISCKQHTSASVVGKQRLLQQALLKPAQLLWGGDVQELPLVSAQHRQPTNFEHIGVSAACCTAE